MDHMRRGTLQVNEVTTLILDEADEMLNMGFREDIETICKDVPEARQTVLFSATMSPEIQAITKRFQRDPETVKASHQQLTVPSIEQVYFEVPGARKADALSRLIDLYDPKLALIFCNTKKRVDDLVSTLQLRGYQADGLHGDLKQSARDRVMDKFRTGRIQLLVATDVAARGIDVDDIEMVFNFDIPQDEEYYVHRIGRTGRAGRSGRAFSFVSGRNDYIRRIVCFKDRVAQIDDGIDLIVHGARGELVKAARYLCRKSHHVQSGRIADQSGRVGQGKCVVTAENLAISDAKIDQ